MGETVMGDEFDGLFDNDVSSYDPFWDRVNETKLKFAWWPQRSDHSGKLIWLKKAYRFRRIITGPGTPVDEDRWLTKDEAMMRILKG